MATASKEVSDDILKSEKGILVTKQFLGAEFLQAVFKFIKNAGSHDPSNQIFDKIFSELEGAIANWILHNQCDSLDLILKGEQFFLNERRIRPRPRLLKKLKFLVKYLRQRKVFGFKIPKGQPQERLRTFFWTVLSLEKGETSFHLAEKLKLAGLSEFEVHGLNFLETEGVASESVLQNLYQQFYQFLKSCFTQMDQVLAETKNIPVDQMLYELNSVEDDELIGFLCQSHTMEPDHPPAHTAVMSAFILHAWGKSLGLPPGVVVELAGCGLAHPFSYLQAAGRPVVEAMSQERIHILYTNVLKLRKHWRLSDLQILALYEYLIPFGERGVYELAARQSYQHFFSRTLRIAVLFQQLISFDRRRVSLSAEKAIEKLLTENFGCDRSLLKLFVQWIGIYPVGSFVRLNTGEIGQICSVSHDLSPEYRPTVGIFTDRNGQPLSQPKIVDLGELQERSGVYKAGIKDSLTKDQVNLSPEKLKALATALALSTSN